MTVKKLTVGKKKMTSMFKCSSKQDYRRNLYLNSCKAISYKDKSKLSKKKRMMMKKMRKKKFQEHIIR